MRVLIEKSEYFKNVTLFSEPLGIEFYMLYQFHYWILFHIEIFFGALSVSSTQTRPDVVFAGIQPLSMSLLEPDVTMMKQVKNGVGLDQNKIGRIIVAGSGLC